MRIEEARDVVGVARSFLEGQESDVLDIRLEQIEERGDGQWSVVLSFNIPNMIAGIPFPNRAYREFILNRNGKEVQAMKVWRP
jgi:hypothetical protein